jgi:hypothetical protein
VLDYCGVVRIKKKESHLQIKTKLKHESVTFIDSNYLHFWCAFFLCDYLTNVQVAPELSPVISNVPPPFVPAPSGKVSSAERSQSAIYGVIAMFVVVCFGFS